MAETGVDVIVIGAGLAGLVCAQQLQRSGYQVIVVEKSRGLGGRLATRRLPEAWADHGVRCLEAQGELSQVLVQVLEQQHILHRWTEDLYTMTLNSALDRGELSRSPSPCYVSDSGITAVAKFLGQGLEIQRSQRVQALIPQPDQRWQIELAPDAQNSVGWTAKAVVMAIPAPQAIQLLNPLLAQGLPLDVWTALQSVQFAPCITAITTYASETVPIHDLLWRAIRFSDNSDNSDNSDVAWVSLERSKRTADLHDGHVVVCQSHAAFAQRYLEEVDLHPVGQQLIHSAARALGTWLDDYEQLQVHRWRYGLVASPWTNSTIFSEVPLPLLCCGDWCGGQTVEAALQSGLLAATQLTAYWQDTVPDLQALPCFQSLIQQLALV